MSITPMHKTIKEVLSDTVVFIRIGNFYETYGEDAIIVSYLFNYRIRHNSDIDSCGFPVLALNKVLSVLDRKTINYDVIDKSHNYEEIVKQNYKRKNNELFQWEYFFM